MGSKGKDAGKVIEFLYQTLIIDAQKTAEIIGKSPKMAYQLIAKMENLEILKEITGASRGKRYVFEDYLKLFS